MKNLMYPVIIGLMLVVLTACASKDEGGRSNKEDKQKTAQTGQQDQKRQIEEMKKKMDKQKVDEKDTVAIVNGEKLLGSDYNTVLATSQNQLQQMGQDPSSKEAAKRIKEQTISTLVGHTLLLQDADKKGYEASDADIKNGLAEVKKRYKNQKDFESAMNKAGIKMDELNSQIAENVKFQKYIDKEIPTVEVTDKEIKEYYQYAMQQSKSDQKAPELEAVKPQIKQQLQQQKKQENLLKRVDILKKNAKVDIKV
jgi:hypothetical protein